MTPYIIRVSTRKHKKYDAVFDDGHKVSFGDKRYQQYKDTTPIKAYSQSDHLDKKRRTNFLARHGTLANADKYSARWFSIKYLW